MSLRNSIENADRRLAIEIAEDAKEGRRQAFARQTQTIQEEKRKLVLKEQASRLFEQHLKPIFREVASAKRIPLSRKWEAGFFGNKPASGFNRYFRDFGSEVSSGGRLIWDYQEVKRQHFHRWGSSTKDCYHFLQMEVKDNGLAIASFFPENKPISILNDQGLSTVWGLVEDIMVNRGGEYFSETDESGPDI